jgi:hypothetical protein
MPVERRRDAESVRVGDRLPEERDERVLDASVLDAG